MKNLISNTAFGKKIESKLTLGEIDYKEYFILRCNYDSFLIKPLEKWMFIPCDEDGNVLEEPVIYERWLVLKGNYPYSEYANIKCEKFQQAKERCLFEGFEVLNLNERISFLIREDMADYSVITYSFVENKFLGGKETIESVSCYNLQLTQTAIKQLESL